MLLCMQNKAIVTMMLASAGAGVAYVRFFLSDWRQQSYYEKLRHVSGTYSMCVAGSALTLATTMAGILKMARRRNKRQPKKPCLGAH